MKKCKKIAALGLAIALLSCSVITAFAAEYTSKIVDEKFDSVASSKFLATGDMNADGAVNATDATSLRKELIGGSVKNLADINGDFSIDVRDLVRQKKIIAENKQHINEGALTFNGSSVYHGDVLSKMGTGASYVVSYSYKSDAPVKVVISGFGEDIVLESAAADTLTSATHTLKTPLSKTVSGDVELRIVGAGTVDNFNITRINMDNELSESWD